jgi:hypothetical protein
MSFESKSNQDEAPILTANAASNHPMSLRKNAPPVIASFSPAAHWEAMSRTDRSLLTS